MFCFILSQTQFILFFGLFFTLYLGLAVYVLIQEYKANPNGLKVSSLIWIVLSLIFPLIIPLVYFIRLKFGQGENNQAKW